MTEDQIRELFEEMTPLIWEDVDDYTRTSFRHMIEIRLNYDYLNTVIETSED